ncbi:DUF2778 domain-containing protein [Burkholderia anthina]|uniref:DUF2778 domain-containing protein n=1 Tax=Burkholderia anthina TaxID=179879 RepID=UPI00158C428F|nr:DUF2778 domain-containing protein [Burkholderia anthina]
MPASCTFILNGQPISFLSCTGAGSVQAFSGMPEDRDKPESVAKPKSGPLPRGIYYIVDRQTGGRLGWLYDFARANLYGTDRAKWFALYRADGNIDDTTIINGVRRGAFRLHPNGPLGRSEGCITVKNPQDFERMSAFIRAQGATVPIPGTDINAYGIVEVR